MEGGGGSLIPCRAPEDVRRNWQEPLLGGSWLKNKKEQGICILAESGLGSRGGRSICPRASNAEEPDPGSGVQAKVPPEQPQQFLGILDQLMLSHAL